MDFFQTQTFSQRLGNNPDPLVVHHPQAASQLLHGEITEIIASQTVHVLFQGTNGLHQRSLKIVTDAHDLSGGLHLCGQRPLGREKLIKGQTRDFHHTVVQRGFKACIGLPGDSVFNLVQRISQGNLGRHLGDRISGGLGSQGRGTAHPGIHLDHTIFKAGGMQGKLHITAAGNLKLIDNVQSGGAKHLVLLVAQGLGRSHHNTVPRMHAHRINIFHITDGNAVACAVPHDLVLNFLPARNTALYQYLSHPGQPQTVLQNFFQLGLIICDAPAGAPQCICGTQYHRITYGISKIDTVLYIFHHQGSGAGLANTLHQILELLTSLRVADGCGCGSQKAYSVSGQKSRFLQLHPQVQPRLASQGRQNTVRLFLFNNLLQHLYGQGLDIYLVRNIFIRHDGGRVGIHQNHLHSFFLQGAAGLGSRIVKLCRLTDHNRAGADNHNTFHIWIFRHCGILLFPVNPPSPLSSSR